MEELKKNKMKLMRGKLPRRMHKAYNKSFIIFNVMFDGVLFSSCIRNIDSKIEKCYNSNDTLVNLSDLYPEEWDTVYFFGACSLEDIEKRIGPVINHLWTDVGNKMLILNKRKEIVYYKEWDMYYGQDLKGAFFRFKNAPVMIAIPRQKANFIIRKRDEKSFWVIYQE